jgi:hypothetical protein
MGKCLSRVNCPIQTGSMQPRSMARIVPASRDALSDVHRTAHNQDLVEVPKRAQFDREAEQAKANQPLAFPEPITVPDKK